MASQEPIMESRNPKILSQEPKATTTSDHQQPITTTTTAPLILPPSYSSRVVLKTILERSDGGVGFVGKKVVIGGWVKSFKEVKKHAAPALSQPQDNDGAADISPGHKDVSCMEILHTRVPLFRSIAKIFGSGGNYPVRAKLEPATSRQTASPNKPAQRPSINLLVSDGSCVASLQVTVESSEALPFQPLPIGTCILAEGILNQLPSQDKHRIGLEVEKILHIGKVEDDKYPLSRKRVPLETLRSCSHFRPRTTTVASVMRIRSALTFATYTFFQDHGFLSVHVPIITTTDGAGFSEKFRVTTLSGKEVQKAEAKISDDTEGISLEAIKAAIREKNNLAAQLKRSESNREALLAVEQDLRKTNQLASHLEAKEKLKLEISTKADKANVPEDFFSQPTYLTVSGRLHLESYACALGNVYSFGPRFRADRRVFAKHVPEMWMVEAEMAFSDLEGAMNCAEDYLKFLCKWVLENCSEDMKFVTKRIDKGRINLLETILSCSYQRITYKEALDVLKQAVDKKVETQPEWGTALTAQQLSYLADEFYKSPVIIYNHPKEVKPFYTRLNDDGKTVAAFDMVVPKGGTLITGSQNEERINVLNERINELGLPKEQYEWCLDLRGHGTVEHSGFSFGFDLMVLFATGIPDVRDAIPFPRSSGKVNS
ncbi:asparagine--tRNA ligase, cytoplasmic 2 [Ricinus communis]|uniref:Aspartyl-tRNA synthetase, putative n=1 Tax=Ricinus communis TaxID=3988 RepID=B9T485_RICCO|nr:asparagine--tRNA ligase, cytoplasmic 2 [Ricinus communis]EEF29324.1 aspartyl-tRNA synthetase, putative [Ricinus communis]|eukprot:XP_002533054.1 asparagine--tRNA ligase, cytoplasmic 2 [Ricinus communis]